MAENTTTIAATPQQVFDVLLDAWSYKEWVVGCDDIRAVDDDWPAVGTCFHHTVGVGPAKTEDETKVLEIDPPRRLLLEARARPAGVAEVEFLLEPDGDDPTKTTLTIDERVVDGAADSLPTPVLDIGLKVRNVETLRRLRHLVESRVGAS